MPDLSFYDTFKKIVIFKIRRCSFASTISNGSKLYQIPNAMMTNAFSSVNPALLFSLLPERQQGKADLFFLPVSFGSDRFHLHDSWVPLLGNYTEKSE